MLVLRMQFSVAKLGQLTHKFLYRPKILILCHVQDSICVHAFTKPLHGRRICAGECFDGVRIEMEASILHASLEVHIRGHVVFGLQGYQNEVPASRVARGAGALLQIIQLCEVFIREKLRSAF